MSRNILQLLLFSIFTSIIISCAEKNDLKDTALMTQDTAVVDLHGLLQVSGNSIVDKNSEPVSFAGNSFFWSNDNWGGER